MIVLEIFVEEPEKLIDLGYENFRIYSDTTETGGFSTLEGAVVLSSGEAVYYFTDDDGDAARWYKLAYYGTVPGEGTKGSAFRGEVLRSYATVDDFKRMAKKEKTNSDEAILFTLRAAFVLINRNLLRPDGFLPTPGNEYRYFSGDGGDCLRVDECISIDEVAVKVTEDASTYTAWPSAEFQVFSGSARRPNWNGIPITGILAGLNTGKTFTLSRLVPTVRLSARWGFKPEDDPVFDLLKAANIAIASRWFQRYKWLWADTIAPGGLGTLLFRQNVDPDIQFMLKQSQLKKGVV